ncbi:hypothetical protein CEXT_713061 [Caerostris extrusa]|uniref:Uncharacterized protein n=1 Tax=Caerostris extrusa TaxID=172846 RepID=A0AAV4PTP6_CAEEX|nr:hypothetical protein CEXT_713061 [Caerostris extrusa]
MSLLISLVIYDARSKTTIQTHTQQVRPLPSGKKSIRSLLAQSNHILQAFELKVSKLEALGFRPNAVRLVISQRFTRRRLTPRCEGVNGVKSVFSQWRLWFDGPESPSSV